MTGSVRSTPLGFPLTEEWDLVSIRDLCHLIGSGSTPKGGKERYQESGIPFIRSQNVHDHRFSKNGLVFLDEKTNSSLGSLRVIKNDVLINITGDGDTIARCCVAPGELEMARCNQHVMVLRTNGNILPSFLQRQLSNPGMRDYMLGQSSGGSRRALTKGQIGGFFVPVPPIREQQRITAILGALDDKIAINERISDISEELCQHLVAENSEKTPRVSVKEICTLKKLQVEPSSLDEPTTNHYSLPAFDKGKLPELASPRNIKSNKFVVTSPSVLISKLNPEIPRVWNVPKVDSIPSLTSTEFLVLEPARAVSTHELWAVTSQPEFTKHLAARVTGTSKSHQRVRPTEVLTTEVIDPRKLGPVREQITALASQSIAAINESRKLAELRDTLLPQLMSGKLRVKDAEKIVEDNV